MEAPEGLSSSAETPRVVYAASSVGDLDAARHFYEGSLELPIRPLSDLHDPADEALWGLAESQRNGFVVDTSGTKLEIVRYEVPLGRPRPVDYRTSDQGLVNVAFGARQHHPIEDAIARVRQCGSTLSPVVRFGDAMGAYSLDPERELELIALPESLDSGFGFKRSDPFWDI